MHNVELSTIARRFFEDADAPLQRKLDRAFDALRNNPHHHNNIKALKGKLKGYHRFRVGDWRVVYVIDDKRQLVFVSDIAHRSEVYE